MFSKIHDPSSYLKEKSDLAKEVNERITEEELRKPKGESGKRKIINFLDECGFPLLKCSTAGCPKYGTDMKWRWRDCLFDPSTDYLIHGKIYNACSKCEQKKVY